ncbi:GtrA family protein [Lachnoanaerobaculum gingivalis]|uniref:GtrA family protein n=1 Tax=Lachnoanaerobaculum gingivalis TaxID=2490855 RepID=A0A3P3QVY4_9FIRM|nr:GtrA family protein [Lachnoanaerobaculum gingivalis]RRJ25427.1 GtrA family protein [Lachnoanaerobaculum gingivalis]WHE87743.1 GtrA family protein [Lachnoanaerobaculum gingivalis]
MIKNLWLKYKELFFYGVFGVGATAINIVSYRILANTFGKKYFLIANIIAWILAFIFAFITNKLFVFESKSWEAQIAMKEFVGFLSARLATGILDTVLMWLFVSVISLDDTLSKIIINILVIIINYIASKFFIFKKE